MSFSFSDLILLMGTNPLPNYVVAKYFISTNESLQRIWIVHSEERTNINQAETKELAKNLKRILEKKEKFCSNGDGIKLIALSDISSAKKIMEDIEEKLINEISQKDFSACHLNYTGGTKAMAVHVYRKLEQDFSDKCTFSYLSGRDFKLKDDEEGSVSGDLREEISIGLDTLMELHGYKKKGEQENPNWPELLDEFVNIIEESKQNNKLNDYLNWVEKFVSTRYFDKEKFIEKTRGFLKHNLLIDKDGNINKGELDELRDTFDKETPDFIINILKMIPEEYSLLNEEGELWIPEAKLSNKKFADRLKKSVKGFLHGKWLEAYVYQVVLDNVERIKKEKNRDIPVKSNWCIEKKQQNNKDFELDVIIVNGYQVTGISVTSSRSERICKEKGFEVLHRVNQIGGEEGKAILVTCLKQTDKVANDLRYISGSTEDKLVVLGIDDLPAKNLWKKISRHIWGEVR